MEENQGRKIYTYICHFNLKRWCFWFTLYTREFLELIQETSIIREYVHWSQNLWTVGIFWLWRISLPSLVLIAMQKFPARTIKKIIKISTISTQVYAWSLTYWKIMTFVTDERIHRFFCSNSRQNTLSEKKI